MVTFNSDGSTTTCPECGKEMGLVTWTGKKPVCAACAGATTTGTPDLGGTIDFDSEEQECLHDLLEESLPPSQRGGPHMLACPCPKCSVWC